MTEENNYSKTFGLKGAEHPRKASLHGRYKIVIDELRPNFPYEGAVFSYTGDWLIDFVADSKESLGTAIIKAMEAMNEQHPKDC